MNIWNIFTEKLPSDIIRDILLFANIADSNNVKIYLVGGAVRDLIIGREVTDADIMVDGDAIEFAQKIAGYLKCKILIHKAFFTAVVYLSSGRKYDFTSTRKEFYPYNGALPIVSPGTITDDLYRRDFTINAIAMKLNNKYPGDIIDCYNGINDISNKLIRVLHDNSFNSDPTRIFRAIRFEAKLGFSLDCNTEKLAVKSIIEKNIDKVSGERLYNELKHICSNRLNEKVIDRMQSVDILSSILSGWKIPTEIDFNRIENIIEENNVISPQLLRITWLISSIESTIEIHKIADRLRIGKYERKHFICSTEILKIIDKINCDNSSGGIDIVLKSKPMDTILLISEFDRNNKNEIRKYLRKLFGFKLLVNGDDILNEGIPADKTINRLMKAVRYAQLNDTINDKNEAIELIRLLMNNHE